MPIDPKDFRYAVAYVQNESTFKLAYAMLQDEELDINSTGASIKSALNFALEKLFTPLLAGKISKEAAKWKLKIIDELCAKSANLEALKHKDTADLMSMVNTQAQLLITKVVAMYHMAPFPKPELETIITTLPSNEQLLLAVHYISNEIVNIARRIVPLEKNFQDAIESDKFASIENKVMLIFENHEDRGTILLLSNIAAQLRQQEYPLYV